MATLVGAFVAIILGLFIAPVVVESYAKEGMVVEPTGLSIDSFTPTGVRARVLADFHIDASRCNSTFKRTIGRVGTYFLHYVESEPTDVTVFLPEYDNQLIGTARVPRVLASMRNGEVTHLEFIAEVTPGPPGSLSRVVNDFVGGRLGALRVNGSADVPVRWGAFPAVKLGVTELSQTLVIESRTIWPIFMKMFLGGRLPRKPEL